MKSFIAFMKKEWLEAARSGKLIILAILFLLFGIMNPAIAKLTPWIFELMAASLAETGMVITEVSVNALTSWTQFFKNIPIGLISFILLYSNTFTKEYQSGTLILILTKGLARYKVALAKSAVMLSLWSACYLLCFAVTYFYNSYFWDNDIVPCLLPAVVHWWLFGVWTISLIVLFSVLLGSNTGVLLGTGTAVLAAYFAGLFPRISEYMPVMLMNAGSLLSGATDSKIYTGAVVVTIVLSCGNIAIGIAAMNKRQL